MAALWCESFQVYPSVPNMIQGAWAQIDPYVSFPPEGGWEISTANPSSGTQGMRGFLGNDVGPVMRRILGSAKATAGIAYRFYVPNLPTNENPWALVLLYVLDPSANVSLMFVLGTDGAVVAYSGGHFRPVIGPLTDATFIKRSEPCVLPTAFNHIEFKVTPANPGTFEVRVNGVTVLNFAGNTIGNSNGTVSQFAVATGCGAGGGSTGTAFIDVGDMHAWDTLAGDGPQDFVGNAAVMTRLLDADTAIADWTLSTGSVGYPLLIDNDDATYIEADSVSVQSAFSAAPFDDSVIGVVYQQANFRALKVGAGDCDVAAGFLSEGIPSLGPASVMTTGEAWFWNIVAEDPATSGAPWSVDGANAAAILLERTL